MHTVKAFYYGGETITTEINGTIASIQDYYIGKYFNIGTNGNDNMKACVKVIIDGIAYNHSTHKYISDRAHNKNLELIAKRIQARNAITKPIVGDILIVKGGYKRFTHAWDDGLQTTCGIMENGLYGAPYLCTNGYASYSGALDPTINYSLIEPTDIIMDGSFWMFNEDYAQAHNAIYFDIPCKVFKLKESV